MKRYIITALAVAAIMTACNSEDGTAADATSTATITFSMTGDFQLSTHDFTRSLEADGKTMTDVWVLDYMNGALVQQVHQSDNTAENFGKPVMKLAYGVHQLYFIVSRGVSPTLDTDAHTLTFGSVRDTFWKRYDVSVVDTTNGNRAVTLDRIVTKLRLTFTDEVPAAANSLSIVPHTWYYGIDYLTGQPASAQTDAATVITIPDASKGQTGIQASLFGFSTAEEWNTDVVISSRTATDEILGSATITSAPFKANRVSDYSGPLFSAGGSLSLSLNGEWQGSCQGSW